MTTQLPMAGGNFIWPTIPNEAPKTAEQRAEILADPGFGDHFTDHMVDMCWSEKGGWHRPRVQAYGPIQLDPAASVLHYGQEIFEGLKAYRHADGSIWSFRPYENAARFQRSARRMAMPELPSEHFVESLRRLIAVDADWVPSEPETCLYLRPFMFAKEAFLGVRPAKKVSDAYKKMFQSTHPHGVRPKCLWPYTKCIWFQSTHPHGVRQIFARAEF